MKQVLLATAFVIAVAFFLLAALAVLIGTMNGWMTVLAVGVAGMLSGAWALVGLLARMKAPSNSLLRASGLRYVQK